MSPAFFTTLASNPNLNPHYSSPPKMKYNPKLHFAAIVTHVLISVGPNSILEERKLKVI